MKLRTYKGVVFDPAIMEWRAGKWRYETAASAVESPYNGLSDYDHAALMDLKANPHEPVVTLEDVLHDAYAEWLGVGSTSLTLSQFVANRLRTAFPHIDQEER